MEKRINKNKGIVKIVITGPESTGKTSLAEYLSNIYSTVFVPEYARDYIEKLNRQYTFEDIEHIAKKQIILGKEFMNKANKILFFDTYLIITKIWFLWSFKYCPDWLLHEIEKSDIDLFLLCNTDIPWIPDKVRENGGENRERLFEIYKSEIENYGFNYAIITGKASERFENAKRIVDSFIIDKY
jgi:NadR type nicotinamide-nucleotide adenylyltransferase